MAESKWPEPILSTKLTILPVRARLVARSRLVQKLDQGLECGFVLVSAPAGYGKSTLLSAWLSQGELATAWLSLDEADNDPARFLTYLAAALHKIEPAVGAVLEVFLPSSPLPPVETLLTPWVNHLAQVECPFWLVLDDYHTIHNQAVHQMVRFLLEHRPAPFHLAMATRADPPFPLSRLRARSQMVELRLADLRFTLPEAEEFLNQVMHLDLAEADLTLLEASTEGWIAGLQMAGLSLQGKEDPSSFIRSFSGENRYVLDFLFEQVLQCQPKDLQDFLLQTSILERLCAPLCDAVTMGTNSQTVLDTLERNNLFLIALDERREWYRYHHLFGDLLRSRLKQILPDASVYLHQRACRWYDAQEMPLEALQHAISSGDMHLVTQIVSANVLVLVENDEVGPALRKVDSLPPDQMTALPWLGIARAWILGVGQVHKSLQVLDAVERNVENVPDDDERRRLKGHIAAARANQLAAQGDHVNSIVCARLADELLPADELTVRAMNLIVWGDTLTDVERNDSTGISILEQALALAQQAQKPHMVMMVSGSLANAHLFAGRMHELHRVCLEALTVAEAYHSQHQRPLSASSEVYALLARGLAEWGENEQAVQMARQGLALSERIGRATAESTCLNYLGRILAFGNDWEQARQVFQRAENIGQNISPWFWHQTAIFALDSTLDCETPHPDQVDRYVRRVQENGISIPALLKARLLLRDNQFSQALVVLEHASSELKGQPSFDTVRIYALRALAYQAMGDERQALAALRQALELAEPENRVATFVREGAAMEKLLRLPQARAMAPEFVQRLLAAFEARRKPKPEPVPVLGALVEPLSEREMDVLKLLAQGYPDKKIAETLVIARGTVHKHLKNIYGKLNVHSRAQAVARARELGLL